MEKDQRIRVAWEPHSGLTSSLNRGLRLAQGEFIARQDSDDWSEPSRLELQLAHMRSHPAAELCGSNAWTHQQNGRRLWRLRLPQTHVEILVALPKGNPFVHGSTMFRREAATGLGGYREAFACSQDYDLFWRLAELHRDAAANLPQALYHYRYSAGSVSAGRAAEQAVVHRAVARLAKARRHGEPEDIDGALIQARKELAGGAAGVRARLKQADHLMLAGAYGSAFAAYLDLVRMRPADPLAWAKLARLGVFFALPPAREACFR
jgi:glycosyltransferase involved in cell wall biosynthesis